MTINEHVATFAGLPVVDFGAYLDNPIPPDDPGGVAWRLHSGYDSRGYEQLWEQLLRVSWVDRIRAIVIGDWGDANDSGPPIDDLVVAGGKLTGLRAVFLGEMTYEECEVSWINQEDPAPLLEAYPALEVLRVRGGENLDLTPVRHASLRELAFETGGLPTSVVEAVNESELPALAHLELWLGTDNYGGDVEVADLAVILSGARLPALAYLGLRDAEIADLLAPALAGAPVVGRLETLDLSLGMLSDVGAAALLSGQPLTHLRRLDLHHHFLSEVMMARLRDELEPAGVELDLSEAEGAGTDEDERYIAVSE